MKYFFSILLVIFLSGQLFAQRKLLVEKIGTNKKYYYNVGDALKIKVRPNDTILRGQVWNIQDSLLSLAALKVVDVEIRDIGSVYKQFAFPKKFAFYSVLFGAIIFPIIVTNHLINNEQVFTSDLFIISGSFIGASLVSLSFSQKQCKIGSRWKIKVLDFSYLR